MGYVVDSSRERPALSIRVEQRLSQRQVSL
jgi:hypothetical protein